MHWLAALLAAPDPSGPPAPRAAAASGEDCATAGDEIVVCGKPRGELSPYRLPGIPAVETGPALPKAALDLGKGKRLAIETEQKGISGFTSNRAMLRLKVPLGRRR